MTDFKGSWQARLKYSVFLVSNGALRQVRVNLKNRIQNADKAEKDDETAGEEIHDKILRVIEGV